MRFTAVVGSPERSVLQRHTTHEQSAVITARERGHAMRPRTYFLFCRLYWKVARKPGRGFNALSLTVSTYEWKTYVKETLPRYAFHITACAVLRNLVPFFVVVWNDMSWFSGELISGMANLRLAASPASCTDCTRTKGNTSCHAPLVTVATREMFARYPKKEPTGGFV